jgi:protein phosphatase
MRLALRYTALSDVGRVRRDNQDSGYAGPHLLAIADGVGGAARGDLASGTAIQQLRRLDQPPGNDALEQLAGAVHLTHDKLSDLVAESPELEGTSTTVTAGLFDGTQLALVHVGDSRAYLLRDAELSQLTKDHTFVQGLVDEGRITEDEARVHPHRHLILRAVDGVHEPEPDVLTLPLQAGDRLLFCSDGCSGALADDELAALLGADSVEEAAPALVHAALEAGSSDNVTVILAEVVADDTDPTAAAPAATEGDAADTDTMPPVVVGAAAGVARPPSRGPLRRRRSEPDQPVDPEALRYAPLPPRGSVWRRRIGVVVLVLVVLAAGAFGVYRWSQGQYYVGDRSGHVAIFKGVDWSVPGVSMHHHVEDSSLLLVALDDFKAAQVRDGIQVSSLQAARDKVASLLEQACPPPAPTPTPTPKPGTKKKSGTKKPAATASPSPTIKPGCPGAP